MCMIRPLFILCLLFTATCLLPTAEAARLFGRKGPPEATAPFCDGGIPAPATGYGADGPFAFETATLGNDRATGKDVTVFFPKGIKAKAPVVFFSHAYGATDWKTAYAQFIPHIVSRGYIVVYAPYPTFGVSIDERYNIMWRGFELAAMAFADRMDLTRVSFTGHSFGGGTVPAMAHKGITGKGWGSKGAFTFMLAPWYSYQTSNAQLTDFPPQVTHVLEVFEDDTLNDQRMAIDLYAAMRDGAAKTVFQHVTTENVNGCKMPATHALPGRSTSLRLKQYSIFRSFDAAADYAFNQDNAGLDELNAPGNAPLRPLTVTSSPKPDHAQNTYQFPWDNSRNPRRAGEEK